MYSNATVIPEPIFFTNEIKSLTLTEILKDNASPELLAPQLVAHLTGEAPLTPLSPRTVLGSAPTGPDFDEVKGQEQVKRVVSEEL